ncbi:hypothetical protein ACJIZ3_002848 [Penstemon smallii]|uniref:Uncharacterized protein n=1 Tax=Penstemon smallii TaxID=265156 RepID=A0ABD3U8Y3_9LAMI
MASNVNFRTPPPPPPSSDDGPTVIVVVFVSFGFIFFVALGFFALWCIITKRKKKTVQETDLISADEHLRVKEAIVEGPHGPQTVVLSVEDDKHIEEKIMKNEELGGKSHMHAKSGEVKTIDLEAGESSSNPRIQT